MSVGVKVSGRWLVLLLGKFGRCGCKGVGESCPRITPSSQSKKPPGLFIYAENLSVPGRVSSGFGWALYFFPKKFDFWLYF